MNPVNVIVFTGNLVTDGEVAEHNEMYYYNNRIAVSRNYTNNEGEYDSDFFSFSVAGKQSYIEKIKEKAVKGALVTITGSMIITKSEKDDKTYTNYNVRADSIRVLSSPKKNTNTEKPPEEPKTNLDFEM